MDYDVLIIGAGPGGIFTAYELEQKSKAPLKVGVFELGNPLNRRKCPIDGDKVKNCIRCKTCSIMSGFGGAGAFSDGKYNITNDFGGSLHEHVGKAQALELMRYVDEINLKYGGEGTKLYSTANSAIKQMCLQHGLHLLDAQVRHLGTDINYIVLDGKGRILHRFLVCDLRRPKRQQVDGRRLPGDGYSHEKQPRGYRCPCGTAGGSFPPSDGRTV